MYLENIGIDRQELLSNLADDLFYAKENYHSTILGEAKEVTYARGRLSGACMVLGLEFEEHERKIRFYSFETNKTIYEKHIEC